ncbi:hypothetical protein [Moraxella oblonga]|uniref:hypothetical protein n=1 Tax=Moraxella oblonga TaxID=200413 RepID=UPI00083207F9|nr:hypothetical protein [Moraxella oblonga]
MKFARLTAFFLTLTAPALTPMLAHSADWTPVFEYLEQNKTGDDGALIGKLMDNIFVENLHSGNYKKINPLTNYAQHGNYPITTPYKEDLLPAKAYKDSKQDLPLKAVIPLKNATLYGYPLKSLTYEYYCFECGGVGFYATLAPMNNAQFQALKQRVHFDKEPDYVCEGAGNSASLERDNKGVYVVLNVGC